MNVETLVDGATRRILHQVNAITSATFAATSGPGQGPATVSNPPGRPDDAIAHAATSGSGVTLLVACRSTVGVEDGNSIDATKREAITRSSRPAMVQDMQATAPGGGSGRWLDSDVRSTLSGNADTGAGGRSGGVGVGSVHVT